MAVHKELGGASHSKKKTSRLKRIILRERADKASTQAGIAAEQAIEGLAKSKSALASLQKQLKVLALPLSSVISPLFFCPRPLSSFVSSFLFRVHLPHLQPKQPLQRPCTCRNY